mmetsp:Transcript_21398/g.20576  ORF Transcript_21398/g.20576 Transcript_21398/m.20576 type:complete len:161 (+) Transcript_21398:11-493(+)
MNYFSSFTSGLKDKVSASVSKMKNYLDEEMKQMQEEQEKMKEQNKEEEILEKIMFGEDFSGDKDDHELMQNAFKYLQEDELEDLRNPNKKRIVLLPWQGIDIQNNKRGMEKLVKEEVLRISNDESKFLMDRYDFEFEFDFNNYIYVALMLKRKDPKLAEM